MTTDLLAEASAPATVLVVDDERVGAAHVRRLIEAQGHRVLMAHSWSEALQSFMSNAVDLVLMDAVMPTVDGFKLTRILRERARTYVPILFLTGLRDDDARRRCVEAGADDLLAKPVDEAELRTRLVAMLRIRRLMLTLEQKNQALDALARVDALTGLLNRRALDEQLALELARSQRYERALSLLMLDVDHFKRVNDVHGHEAGDQLLAVLGATLRQSIRTSDRAYRFGGEELVVMAPETPSAGALTLADRLRVRASAATQGMVTGPQTFSVGVATLSSLPPDADARALRSAADAALYEAKRMGRDRVVLYGA